MKIEKKYLIAGGIGIITITGALLYLQYKRLMNYCIGINKVAPRTLTPTVADIDLFLNFKNQSDLKFEILGQSYDVYVNEKLMTTASNQSKQVIMPNSMNVIKVNIKFNPTQSGKNLISAALQLGNTAIKVDVKMKVKLWMFTVNIPYVYTTTIKEILAPSDKSSTSVICK